MEFLEGRIFTGMSMPGVPPEVRPPDRPLVHQPARLFHTPLKTSWPSAVRTLGALSSLDPKAVGLENFGSHKPYFPRQIKSLSKVTLAQAAVRDVDSSEFCSTSMVAPRRGCSSYGVYSPSASS
jgi:aminoglycoside phosphotransferase (APT) family kinase protein